MADGPAPGGRCRQHLRERSSVPGEVDPRRPANSLSAPEARRLHSAVQGVLADAIEFRGTTFLDYRDAEGNPGGFVARLRVYDRTGVPCLACDTPVERIVQGGRSTFFVLAASAEMPCPFFP